MYGDCSNWTIKSIRFFEAITGAEDEDAEEDDDDAEDEDEDAEEDDDDADESGPDSNGEDETDSDEE